MSEEDLLATIEDGPPLDQWGRYKLPDPRDGRERGWVRATTLAQTLSDKFGLARWELRMVAHGLGQREDLMALAGSTDLEDTKTLDEVCRKALEAARGDAGANKGTAVHQWTASLDMGKSVGVPKPYNRDVAAYQDALVLWQFTILPRWIERIVVVPSLGVAGTLDRVVLCQDNVMRILDVKTTKRDTLKMSFGEIAIQLALYANSTHAWVPASRSWEETPVVDTRTAYIAHIPIGEGVCEIHEVDITKGWERARLADRVRQARRSAKKLVTPHSLWQEPCDRIRQTETISELRQVMAALSRIGRLTEKVKDCIRQQVAELNAQETA